MLKAGNGGGGGAGKANNDVRTATNVVSPYYGLGPSWRYTEAHRASMFWHISWSRARNLQELIDSTTGVVLAPKVQPAPHQVKVLAVDEMEVFGLFATPAKARSQIIVGVMLTAVHHQ